MELTINIKDKIIKDAINNRLDYTYNDFDDDVIKSAGIPTRTQMAKMMFTDVKFHNQLAKELTEYAIGYITDMMDYIDYKPLADAYDRCEEEYDKKYAAEDEIRRAKYVKQEIDNAVAVLTKAGYKVTK